MTSALRRLLDEPKFVAQVARFAAMWRGMGREGFSEAVYWLELLIQYGHLDHLRINDGDLNFVQYFCLDVLALYLVLVMALFAGVGWVVRRAMMGWLERTRVTRSSALALGRSKKTS